MPDFTKYGAPTRPSNHDAPRPMEGGFDAIKGVQNLIRLFGREVEPALYALLCDTRSDMRQTIDKALKGGTQTANVVLVPLLISQFSIAPAIATMVAAVTVQAIATVGQEKLCQAMAPVGRRAAAAAPASVAAPAAAIPVPAPTPTPAPAPKPDPEPLPTARSKVKAKQAISSIMPRTTVVTQATLDSERVAEGQLAESKPFARVKAKARVKTKVKAKTKTPAKAKPKTKAPARATAKKKSAK